MEFTDGSGRVLQAALKVHSALGPGLLESAYEACLCIELRENGIEVERQVQLPIIYGGQAIEAAYRLDLLVQKHIVVEVKAVASILPIHEAQLITYLRLSGYPVGLLLNFQVARMRDGMKRFVNSR